MQSYQFIVDVCIIQKKEIKPRKESTKIMPNDTSEANNRVHFESVNQN